MYLGSKKFKTKFVEFSQACKKVKRSHRRRTGAEGNLIYISIWRTNGDIFLSDVVCFGGLFIFAFQLFRED